MSGDPAALRAEFPLLAGDPGLHYLDSAASAQTPRIVLDAVARHETTARANVHRGVHRLAEAATAAYEEARTRVARYLNVPAAEIVFASGATAAINLVAHSFSALLAPGDEILISELEHHSNIVPWQLAAERRGLVLTAVPVTADGRLDHAVLERLVGRRTKLIALTHASNVTGAVTDVARVVAAARSVGARVLLDGAQRAPHGPLDLPALGVDFYAFSGHKMFAPNGVGVLWARAELLAAMPPFLGGGEMIKEVRYEGTIFNEGPHRFEAVRRISLATSGWARRWPTWMQSGWMRSRCAKPNCWRTSPRRCSASTACASSEPPRTRRPWCRSWWKGRTRTTWQRCSTWRAWPCGRATTARIR